MLPCHTLELEYTFYLVASYKKNIEIHVFSLYLAFAPRCVKRFLLQTDTHYRSTTSPSETRKNNLEYICVSITKPFSKICLYTKPMKFELIPLTQQAENSTHASLPTQVFLDRLVPNPNVTLKGSSCFCWIQCGSGRKNGVHWISTCPVFSVWLDCPPNTWLSRMKLYATITVGFDFKARSTISSLGFQAGTRLHLALFC